MTDYSLEVTKLVEILKSPLIQEEHKAHAQKRLNDIRFKVTKSQYNIPEDRIEDVMHLEDIINSPVSTIYHKDAAKKAIKKIVNENKDIRSMRKRLIKEMRSGRSDNVRDITEFVQKHSKYQ